MFARRHRTTRLVFMDTTNDVRAAIAREKQIKSWTRTKKLALIAARNPEFRDLADEWLGTVG
jgi:putative endonuclease